MIGGSPLSSRYQNAILRSFGHCQFYCLQLLRAIFTVNLLFGDSLKERLRYPMRREHPMFLAYLLFGIMCGVPAALIWLIADGGMLSAVLVYTLFGHFGMVGLASFNYLAPPRMRIPRQ